MFSNDRVACDIYNMVMEVKINGVSTSGLCCLIKGQACYMSVSHLSLDPLALYCSYLPMVLCFAKSPHHLSEGSRVLSYWRLHTIIEYL